LDRQVLSTDLAVWAVSVTIYFLYNLIFYITNFVTALSFSILKTLFYFIWPSIINVTQRSPCWSRTFDFCVWHHKWL